MSNYRHHSIALNDEDQKIYEEVHASTGFGVTAIFKAMLRSLKKQMDEEKIKPIAIHEEE